MNQGQENNIEDLIIEDINTINTLLVKSNKCIKKMEEISTLDPAQL